MPIRYYPISKVKTNKRTSGNEFLLNGAVYAGPYYETFDGKFFTGPNPIVGPNEQLSRITEYRNNEFINLGYLPSTLRNNLVTANDDAILKSDFQNEAGNFLFAAPKFKGEPTSYFPIAIKDDYAKGFMNRYFAKRVNSRGFVIEISEQEYIAIKKGEVPYDVSNYLTTKLFWKITGPLNQKRYSQYDIRAGIIDTNKRLVETAEKTFLGLVAFIDGKYDKFAKPTE